MTQGEEVGDCRRHVSAHLQVGPGDGAQIRRREFSWLGSVLICNHDACLNIVNDAFLFFCLWRRTRTKRRAKMRSTAPSWRLRRTARLRGWWTCTVGGETLSGSRCEIICLSARLNYSRPPCFCRRQQQPELHRWLIPGETRKQLQHQPHPGPRRRVPPRQDRSQVRPEPRQ